MSKSPTPAVELSACPFCGNGASTVLHTLEQTWSVGCDTCYAGMAFVGITEAEAIAAWNTRTPKLPDDAAVERAVLRAEIINAPETADFMAGVPIEAAHQRERWGSSHDAGKTPEDWFWLIGYLAQKALRAQNAGDVEKAKHHTISTAAALGNWHAALTGADTSMRPGIDPPAALSAPEETTK